MSSWCTQVLVVSLSSDGIDTAFASIDDETGSECKCDNLKLSLLTLQNLILNLILIAYPKT